MQAEKHLLRYVKGSVNMGFTYSIGTGDLMPITFADASYVTDMDNCMSTTVINRILTQLALKSDAQSTIRHVANNTKRTQTKNFAFKFNFVGDLYIKVVLQQVPSEEQAVNAASWCHPPILLRLQTYFQPYEPLSHCPVHASSYILKLYQYHVLLMVDVHMERHIVCRQPKL
jgi:hypothetical protein